MNFILYSHILFCTHCLGITVIYFRVVSRISSLVKEWSSQNFGHQKCWPFVHGLPKLVANISYQFQHLVNTVLAVVSLVKWIPLKIAHTSKIDKVWVIHCSPISIGSIEFNILGPVEFYIQRCGALQQIPWHSYLKKFNMSLPWKLIFLKSYQLVAFRIFQSSYLGHGESQIHKSL